MRPKQAQPVEDYDDCAAFVTNHASGEINFLCQRGDDQEQNDAERNNDVLTNDRASAPAEHDCFFDILNFVVHQDDVGLFQRSIGSPCAHADGHIRRGQAGRVIDSVADHRHLFPRRAPIVNALQFGLWAQLGADIGYADLLRHHRSRSNTIAREQCDPQTGALEEINYAFRRRPDLIAQINHSESLIVRDPNFSLVC
jgi:hypothetical protein